MNPTGYSRTFTNLGIFEFFFIKISMISVTLIRVNPSKSGNGKFFVYNTFFYYTYNRIKMYFQRNRIIFSPDFSKKIRRKNLKYSFHEYSWTKKQWCAYELKYYWDFERLSPLMLLSTNLLERILSKLSKRIPVAKKLNKAPLISQTFYILKK